MTNETNETHEADGEAQSLKSVPDITRRRVLQGAAAAGAVGMLSGVGSAQEASSNRYIVGLEAQTGYRVATARAVSVDRRFDFGSIGKAVAGQFSKQERADLKGRSDVRYVVPDVTMHALAETLPWGINRVDADKVHARGQTGADADIAIIDSGIDADHPDLEANLGTGKAFVQCTGGQCQTPWDDDNSHGTHCAGIADAIDNTEGVIGVSTQATLHAAKVLDSTGVGSGTDIAAAIEWTADQGYDVGSLSLGGDANQPFPPIQDACQYAVNNGVLLVAAAGNDGGDVGYPAALDTVMAVSATDQNDNLAEFSSRGPEIELAAPGVQILSTVPESGYAEKPGTSMACPHVSGAGAQLMAQGYSNTEARQRLNNTAEDIGLPENHQGNGLLDVEAAVPEPKKTLRVEGTGKYAFYAFTASGDVTITEDDKEDEVDGSTADGAVGPDSDSYTFTGTLESLHLSGDAKVFVNDKQIDPNEYPSSLHSITFKGKGNYATYEFSVSEAIVDSRGLDQEDSISGNHAEGAVNAGQELYVYTGDLTNLTTTGDPQVIKADVTHINGDGVDTTNEEEVNEDDT
jgi:subtilisin family serine protease